MSINTSHLSMNISQDSVESPENDGKLSRFSVTLVMIWVWNEFVVGMLVAGMLREGHG